MWNAEECLLQIQTIFLSLILEKNYDKEIKFSNKNLRKISPYRQSSDASFYCDPVAEAHIILIAPLRQQRPTHQAMIVRQKVPMHNN